MLATDLNIRLATETDSQAIWAIRNCASIRQISSNQEAIDFTQHQAWFKQKYFSGQDNHCLVLVSRTLIIGYCRLDFDQKNNYHLISIALDPAYQHQGLGSYLLKYCLNQFADKTIVAEIKKSNLPSLKLFQTNGLAIEREDENNFYLKRAR